MLLQIASSSGVCVSGFLSINLRGKRLNKNPKQVGFFVLFYGSRNLTVSHICLGQYFQMKSVVYAADERLRANVAQKRWPLLDFRVLRKNQPQIFCGQAVTLTVDVSVFPGLDLSL